MIRLLHGDAMEILPTLSPASVHSIVTDPPYGLKQTSWDDMSPRELQEFTREWSGLAAPALKHGAHVAVFTAPRLAHRVAAGLEDAGFEIRDLLAWLFNTGFPKAQPCDVEPEPEKGANCPDDIDRSATADELKFRRWLEKDSTIDRAAAVKRLGKPYDRFWTGEVQAVNTVARWKPAYWARCANIPTPRVWRIMKEFRRDVARPIPDEIEALCQAARIDDGRKLVKGSVIFDRTKPSLRDTEPSDSPWTGWATGLRPAMEIVVLARRPLGHNTITRNQWREGVGALNIADTRIDGRWPGNVLADSEAIAHEVGGLRAAVCPKVLPPDPSAAHPTAKPADIMQWLQTLITPAGGLTLDPFVGAGAAAVAARCAGFEFVGIEKDGRYVEIARARALDAETLFDLGLAVEVSTPCAAP